VKTSPRTIVMTITQITTRTYFLFCMFSLGLADQR
jgi:hypothetical protein